MTTTAAPANRRSLSFVQPELRQPKLSVLLFGPPKRGKSTGAASAPGPILYVNAEASSALDFPRARFGHDHIREIKFLGKATLNDLALYLREGAEGEQTVVLDTVGEMHRILLEEMAPNGRPSLQQYGDAGTLVERFCRFLTTQAPQNVVLVCHENPMDTGDGIMLMPQAGGRKNPQILCAMADVIGYVGVVAEKDRPDRYIAQVAPDERRYAGNRNDLLGRVADLDLTRWCELYSSFAKPKEKK
jgi:AAA domain-containing protein